jgi:hypothetical protein
MIVAGKRMLRAHRIRAKNYFIFLKSAFIQFIQVASSISHPFSKKYLENIIP